MTAPVPTAGGLESVDRVELRATRSSTRPPRARASSGSGTGRSSSDSDTRPDPRACRGRRRSASCSPALTLLRFGEPELATSSDRRRVPLSDPRRRAHVATRRLAHDRQLMVAAPRARGRGDRVPPDARGQGPGDSSRSPLRRAAGAAAPLGQSALPHARGAEASVNVAVFGASGVIGSALVPELAERARGRPRSRDGPRRRRIAAVAGRGRHRRVDARRASRASTSSSTSFTRSARRPSRRSTARRPRTLPALLHEPGCDRSCSSAASATTARSCRSTCAAGTRRREPSLQAPCP